MVWQAEFRHIVSSARLLRPDLDIIDRCNLTVVHEPEQADLIDFLAEHKVHVIASLPCYSAKVSHTHCLIKHEDGDDDTCYEGDPNSALCSYGTQVYGLAHTVAHSQNVNQQRGAGVFDRSISALLALNEKGYGVPGSGLVMDLVYNPLGAFLPPPQESLEAKYKEELMEEFGVVFTNLYTMTNMPVKRFADFLHRRGELQEYMELLVRNFNIDTTSSLMCTNTVSVGWDGSLFDCDFNQQLGVGVGASADEKGLDEKSERKRAMQRVKRLEN